MNLMNSVARSALLHKNIFSIRYSREYLRSLDIDQKQVQQIKTKTQLQLKKQLNFNRSVNDRNSNNHIKVRLNHPLFNVTYHPQSQVQTCSILEPQPIKPRKFIHATRKHIITSIKKCKQALYPIKRLYIIDAINALMSSNKKVAKLMIRTFWNLLDHAKQRGYDPMRLWVHGCLIGKTKRYFGVRYHAKGRGSRQKRDFCQVKIVLYEKQQPQFLQQLAEGKCPAGLANSIRKCLLDQPDSNYQLLTRFGYITTSKGRQQASEMIKRRIHTIMDQNQKKGVFIPLKVVRKKLLEQLALKVRQDLNYLNSLDSQEKQLLKRQQLYKKNMGISD